MYQSIPAVDIPLGFAHPFGQPPGFSQNIFDRGARFRSAQIFLQINKNLQCISILSQSFQEDIKNGRKNFCFRSQ